MKRFILATCLLISVSFPALAGIIETPGYCGQEVCPPPPCEENCGDLQTSEPEFNLVNEGITLLLDGFSIVF